VDGIQEMIFNFGVAEFGHELCLSTFCRDVAMLRLLIQLVMGNRENQ